MSNGKKKKKKKDTEKSRAQGQQGKTTLVGQAGKEEERARFCEGQATKTKASNPRFNVAELEVE